LGAMDRIFNIHCQKIKFQIANPQPNITGSPIRLKK
jgi:hypothetical protein